MTSEWGAMRLSHIGIALKNPTKFSQFMAELSIPFTGEEVVEDQLVKTSFFQLSDSPSRIEVLIPTDRTSTVAKYLEKFGSGVHHIAIAVPSGKLEQITEYLAMKGYRVLFPKPKTGAHRALINFVHPSDTGGVLVELMEEHE